MTGKNGSQVGISLLAAWLLCGCDPNPHGPSAPTAAPRSESRPEAPAKNDETAPLQHVGPPAGPAR